MPLLTPHLEIVLHKMIRDVNDHLLRELRIAHPNGIDDSLMIGVWSKNSNDFEMAP